MSKSKLGVYGLGVMGSSLALNMLEKGFSISVFNRDEGSEKGTVSSFLEKNSGYDQLSGFTNEAGFIASLERPRRILIMVKAGPVIDLVIQQLLPFLEEGDILIDGGNSHFKDTQRRMDELSKTRNIHFLGVGISGGEKGARYGASLMPGGMKEAYEMVSQILTSIAAKDTSQNPCCTFIGEQGSGHFVKMVHNGIEYVEMQLIAESYSILKQNYSNEQISEIFSEWNKGELESYLLEITAEILLHQNEHGYLIDQILDAAGSKGTGSWSTIAALETGVVNTMMSSSVFARYVSNKKEERISLSKKVSSESVNSSLEIQTLKTAYKAARIVNHHQGFELIRASAKEYNWSLDFSELARIWTNGCIIRSRLMEELSEIFKQSDSLLNHSESFQVIRDAEKALSEVVKSGIDARIPTPAFSSGFEYWISITSENLSSNMIQAQRDFFGAHTYQLKNDPTGSFYHTNWENND
ncbi:MAG: decarboxylating NADP(+)-dependent phosphogluconate dehydrogenase [Balneola sp.]|nr:MAG: decarboxylating NADP(+)-dependent phosphogluconate dehydrogenase [Balneola sp.]